MNPTISAPPVAQLGPSVLGTKNQPDPVAPLALSAAMSLSRGHSPRTIGSAAMCVMMLGFFVPTTFGQNGPREPPTVAGPAHGGIGKGVVETFDDEKLTHWSRRGGDWRVVEGRLLGKGDGPPLDSLLIRKDFQVRDVFVSVDLISDVRADRFVILRYKNTSNYIQVNFRAEPFNDIAVFELTDGSPIVHDIIPNPVADLSGIGIHADLSLIGQRLAVTVNAQAVVDRTFGFSTRVGRVGLGVIDDEFGDGESRFDNFSAVSIRRGESSPDQRSDQK